MTLKHVIVFVNAKMTKQEKISLSRKTVITNSLPFSLFIRRSKNTQLVRT